MKKPQDHNSEGGKAPPPTNGTENNGNEFNELYNEAKLQKPIKKIEVRNNRFYIVFSIGKVEACTSFLEAKGPC